VEMLKKKSKKRLEQERKRRKEDEVKRQEKEDEELARKLQEEMDREYAMYLNETPILGELSDNDDDVQETMAPKQPRYTTSSSPPSQPQYIEVDDDVEEEEQKDKDNGRNYYQQSDAASTSSFFPFNRSYISPFSRENIFDPFSRRFGSQFPSQHFEDMEDKYSVFTGTRSVTINGRTVTQTVRRDPTTNEIITETSGDEELLRQFMNPIGNPSSSATRHIQLR